MDFDFSIFLPFLRKEERDVSYKFLQPDQNDRKQPSATFHNSTAHHLKGVSSNTKSHGKFLSKIRPLLLRKDIIQDCFDHCAITDSSLKLLSTISVQGSVRLRVTGRKCQGLHLITLLRNFYLLQIRQLGLAINKV